MTLVNILKEKRLRLKIYYTLFVLLVSATLAEIPVPGLNSTYFAILFSSTSVLDFMDSMAGGSLSNLAIAGFGVTSYISASIILQLMSILIPKIEQVRRNGHQGRMLIDRITFILAMVITLVGSLALSITCGKMGLFTEYSLLSVLRATVCWMLGSAAIILLAQKVEDYGIGNGITMVLSFNILSRIPNDIVGFYSSELAGKDVAALVVGLVAFIVVLYFFYLAVIYLQVGVLNIPIKQNKKQASIMNTDAKLPIPVNIANVTPVIYASTLISFPSIIAMIFNIEAGETFSKILEALSSANWYAPTKWYHVVGFVLYTLLLIGFGSFSSQMSFNPDEIANNMRKSGDVIPGVKPGKDTVAFLEKRRKVMTAINVVFLIVISIVPDFVCTRFEISQFSFLGTSLIIVIHMMFDTALRLRASSIHNDKQFALFVR